jgi:hypothetical protein
LNSTFLFVLAPSEPACKGDASACDAPPDNFEVGRIVLQADLKPDLYHLTGFGLIESEPIWCQ